MKKILSLILTFLLVFTLISCTVDPQEDTPSDPTPVDPTPVDPTPVDPDPVTPDPVQPEEIKDDEILIDSKHDFYIGDEVDANLAMEAISLNDARISSLTINKSKLQYLYIGQDNFDSIAFNIIKTSTGKNNISYIMDEGRKMEALTSNLQIGRDHLELNEVGSYYIVLAIYKDGYKIGAIEKEPTIITYPLEIKAVNGSVTVTEKDGEQLTELNVIKGRKYIISLNPEEGYRLDEILVDGTKLTVELVNNSFEMSFKKATSLEFKFVELKQFNLTIETIHGDAYLERKDGKDITEEGKVFETIPYIVNVIPEEGYHLVDVSDGTTSLNVQVVDNKFEMIFTKDMNLKIEFASSEPELKPFNLTVNASHGEVSYICKEDIPSAQSIVLETLHYVFTVKADNGYHFVNVLDGDKPLNIALVDDQMELSFHKDTTLTFIFEEDVHEYQLTMEASHGSISIGRKDGQAMTQGKVLSGVIYVVTLNPEEGYRFDKAQIGGNDVNVAVVNNQFEISFTGDVSLKVFFEQAQTPDPEAKEFNLTLEASHGSASISRKDGSSMTPGKVIENVKYMISVTPDAGYHLAKVLDGDTELQVNVSYGMFEMTFTKDTNLKIVFERTEYQLDLVYSNGTVRISRKDGIAMSSNTVVYENVTYVITVTPNSGYHYVKALLNGEDLKKTLSNNKFELTFSENSKLEIVMLQDELTLTIQAENGSARIARKDGEPMNDGKVLKGVTYVVTVTPNSGYHYSKVLLNGANQSKTLSSDNTFEISFTKNSTLKIVFESDEFTLTIQANNGKASIKRKDGKTMTSGKVLAGVTYVVTVTPNSGYHYEKVLLNNVDLKKTLSNNTFEISFTENSTLNVIFALDEYKLTIQAENGNVTIARKDGEAMTSGKVLAKTTYVLTFAANAGCQLSTVTINGVEKTVTNNKLETTFTQDSTVVATFQVGSISYDGDSVLPENDNLATNVQDGVILHAFNWSYKAIEGELPAIKMAGYSAVQVSPVQQPKDYAKKLQDAGYTDQWSKLYQPLSFSIADATWLGTKADLISLCSEAHKYGIKIIADVVTNHMANNVISEATETPTNKATLYQSSKDAKGVDAYEGNVSGGINQSDVRSYIAPGDGSAYSVCKGNNGWPDLKTETTKVQNRVISLLKECIDCGIDGFRFDAAKHIETPDDGADASQFWPNILNAATSYAKTKSNKTLYYYGEILNTPGNGRSWSSYTKYMSITDNKTGNAILQAVNSHNASGAAQSGYNTGQPANKLVLWAESHDTFCGDAHTNNIDAATINKAWAIVASRKDASALYLARPVVMGKIGLTDYKNIEVSAVNNFHNDFVGANEYLSSSGNYVVIQRYDANKCGAVIVNVNGNTANLSGIAVNNMTDGTYYDQITGNQFTVSGKKLSGQMGSTGIVVLKSTAPVLAPEVVLSQAGGTFSRTLTVNFTLKNASSCQITINGTATEYKQNGSFTLTGSNGNAFEVRISVVRGDYRQVYNYTYIRVDGITSNSILFTNVPKTFRSSEYQLYAWVWHENINNSGKFVKATIAGDYVYVAYDNMNINRILLTAFDAGKTIAWTSKPYQTADYIVSPGAIYNVPMKDADGTVLWYVNS